MDKTKVRQLSGEDIQRLKDFARANPGATRREYAKVAGMSYSTLLRCLAAADKQFGTHIVDVRDEESSVK